MAGIYYEAPGQEEFDDMKSAATEVWNGMDNTYGYVDEKLARIEGVQNVGDNFMYLFAMFDMDNQRKVVDLLAQKTQDELRLRMVDGGNSRAYLIQLGLYD